MSFFERFRKYPELKTVIVNLESGTAFRGVIWRSRGAFYIVRNAILLQDRGQKVNSKKIDGEILLERAKVDFIQVL